MNPADRSSSGPSDDAIDQLAADWLGRRDGGLGRADEAELQRWLSADRRHAIAFARLEAASHALDQLVAFRPATANTLDPDPPLRARRVQTGQRPRRRLRLAPIWAAAAALVLGFVVLRPNFSPLAPTTTLLSTQVGGWRSEILEDGSRLALNTDSEVEIKFTARERRVELQRGEVLFTVAKEAARPFVVYASGVRVRAVGTAFNVRVSEQGVDVLVTEGQVRLDDAVRGQSLLPSPADDRDAPVLTAGHRAVIPSAVQAANPGTLTVTVTTIEASEMLRRLAWQEQRLEFGPSPLREVAAEFNRYNRHQLVVADERTAAISVGGSFRADDHETFVRLLESSFDIVAERNNRETILRLRR